LSGATPRLPHVEVHLPGRVVNTKRGTVNLAAEKGPLAHNPRDTGAI